ncbi:MAG: hypothetical protein AAFX79_09505 [Planctomycetota bacterium]
MRGTIRLAVALAGIAMIGGCVDQARVEDEVGRAREGLHALRASLDARERALRDALADPQAPPAAADLWRAELGTISAQRRAADEAIRAADDYADDPAGGVVTRTVGTVAPLVPEPYRLPLVLGAGAIAALARGVQLRRAGRAIARGVQRALDADPQLAERFGQQAAVVRGEQSALAQRLVDEATGRRTPRPI